MVLYTVHNMLLEY
uniref:Uncharacterized protein n=1 Tax=Arundo donax TaxID=35708 RepID=A0A0A9A4I6_ARUDO